MCKEKSSKFEVFSNGFVKITKENAKNAKNAISKDPFYNRAYDKKIEGSSALFFDEYKNNDTKDKMSEILSALNTENSTRVSGDDLKDICNNICTGIGAELRNSHDKKCEINEYGIIESIYNGVKSGKTLLSYASKFCHFYSLHMVGDTAADNYPIIDSILRKVIPIYDYIYTSEFATYNEYQGGNLLYKCRVAQYSEIKEKYKEGIVGYYLDYVLALRRIRDAVNRNVEKEKQKITVTEIEQLLWWFYRGIADDVDGIKKEAREDIEKF